MYLNWFYTYISFSCTPVSRARTTLFLSSPLFSCLPPLSWPTTPAFANLYFRRSCGCRRVPPGAAGGRRAPPQKSLFFIGFSYIGVPKSLKIVVFFNVFRTKSLKIIENRCFSIVFRTNSSKIVENRCFSIVFRTFS